jgi:hypothetical protein
MDFKAFINEKKVWSSILEEMGWTNLYLRDKRYEAVVHLVTAADGAAEFYNHVYSN